MRSVESMGSVGVWVCGSSTPTPPNTHTPTLVKADIEGLIYLVILVLWIFSKVFRRKQQPSDTMDNREATDTDRGEMPEDLREMLETLTGQKIEPVRAPPPPPPIEYRAPPPPPHGDIPKRRKQAAAAAAKAAQRLAEVEQETANTRQVYAAGLTARVTQTRSSDAAVLTMAMRSVSSGMAMTQMPSLGAGVSLTMGARAAGPGRLRYLLGGSDELRRAIISREVLGRPKAFEV
jgi:hypothetical protein